MIILLIYSLKPMLWVLMSTHNIGFYEDLTKTIFELSSNTYLISSAEKKWHRRGEQAIHIFACTDATFNDINGTATIPAM